MITLKFRSLQALGIMGATIPDSQVLLSIDGIISMLNEVEKNYQIDLDSHRFLLGNMQRNAIDFPRFQMFMARERLRIGSYIVFSLNLEGILKTI